jgi:hypothetical protein
VRLRAHTGPVSEPEPGTAHRQRHEARELVSDETLDLARPIRRIGGSVTGVELVAF